MVERVKKIEYVIEFYTLPGKNAIIDGTNVNYLHGWPTCHQEILLADSNVQAIRLFEEWKEKFNLIIPRSLLRGTTA